MNKESLRQAIARNLGLLVLTGTMGASPTPTTTAFAIAELAAFTQADIKGRHGAVTDGAGEFIATTLSSTTLTLYYALPATPSASGDKVEVYDSFRKSDYDDAISFAINSVRGFFLEPRYDRTSLIILTSTYEYSVPAGFDYISKLTVEATSGQWDRVIPDKQWELTYTGGLAKIRIHSAWPLTYAGKTIEVIGANYPTAPTTESGLNPIDDSYVINYASWLLGTRMPTGQGNSAGWNVKVNEWMNNTREYLSRNTRAVSPSGRRVPGR